MSVGTSCEQGVPTVLNIKKMKKITLNIFKYTFIAVITMVLASCESVLNVDPKGVLAEGQLESAESVDKLVTAAYAGLASHYFGNFESMVGPTTNWTADVRSDDAYKGGGGIGDLSDLHNYEVAVITPINAVGLQKWRNMLFGVSRTNFAIREIIKLDDANYPKEERIAEMRVLRGFYHFELLRTYGQYIPYLSEDTNPEEASNTQYTKAELVDLIEADFQAGVDNLPDAHNDEPARVNKFVAAALLTKLYIDNQEWSNAIASADMVINSGQYSLIPEFGGLNDLEFEFGDEAVFQISYSTANNFANHDWGNLLNVTASPGIDAGGYAAGDDFYLASQNLVNAFRTDANGLPLFDTYNDVDVLDGSFAGTLDPRLDWTVGRIGIPWDTAIYNAAWVRSPDYNPGFSGKKMVVEPDEPSIHTSFPWGASGLNGNLIRYAEVLLWKAEALIESGGSLEDARTLVNEVRLRAKNSQYVTFPNGAVAANYLINEYPAGWSQDYARNAVRFERRLELAMEGHRMFDLVRWGNAAQVINQYYQEEKDNVAYLNDAFFESGKHEYLPVPQSEIDLAPSIYSQNPSY